MIWQEVDEDIPLLMSLLSCKPSSILHKVSHVRDKPQHGEVGRHNWYSQECYVPITGKKMNESIASCWRMYYGIKWLILITYLTIVTSLQSKVKVLLF